jgi:hypothetical protein
MPGEQYHEIKLLHVTGKEITTAWEELHTPSASVKPGGAFSKESSFVSDAVYDTARVMANTSEQAEFYANKLRAKLVELEKAKLGK